MSGWDLVAWFGTAGGLAGAGMIAYGRPLGGQVVWLVANPLLVAWGLANSTPQTVILFSAYTAVALAGVVAGFRKRMTGGREDG